MVDERLKKQINFIIEMDKLKTIFRKSTLIDNSRNENDAEHSWHLAIMTVLLSEYINEEDVDILRVLKMVLIHDIVEIDAGDTFCYDEDGYKDKLERETKAAIRIFNILPKEQSKELMELWNEFEEIQTLESKVANSFDRLQPLIQNYITGGKLWKKEGITNKMALNRNKYLSDSLPKLWEYAKNIINISVEKGYLIAE